MEILIAVIVVVVVVALVVWLLLRRSRARTDDLRVEAGRHRALADVARLDAEAKVAAAEERAARARREQLLAEQERLDADAAHEQVADLENRADEIDPDLKD